MPSTMLAKKFIWKLGPNADGGLKSKYKHLLKQVMIIKAGSRSLVTDHTSYAVHTEEVHGDIVN